MTGIMLDLLTSRGIGAVVFGLESLVVPSAPATASAIASADRALLFRRSVLDPKSEPLAPLLRNKPGVVAQSSAILAPFFRDTPPAMPELYAHHEGFESYAREIRLLRDAGIKAAIWDNCPAGASQRVHALLDESYHGLFPRHLRVLSAKYEAQLGEEKLVNALLRALNLKLDDLLCVTPNPGHRDHALRRGIAAFHFDPGAPSLLSSLAVYIGADGYVRDPLLYIGDLGRLPEAALRLPSYIALQKNLMQLQNCGSLQADFRCLLIDRKVWAPGGLAEDLSMRGLPPPPRFKPQDEVLADAMSLIDEAIAQIERGLPSLARSAMTGLISELTALCRSREDGAREAWLIRPMTERLSSHIRDNRRLYTEISKVFHEDEWVALDAVFRSDDESLDRRYEEWVEKTQSLMREMSASHESLKGIRKMVKERLIDDLILGMMELEMHYRCLLRDRPLPELFPRHHDSKNRAVTMTANIGDKNYWKKAVAVQTKTLHGWIHGLAMGMVRKAREAGGQITFVHEIDAGLPHIDLADLNEAERESIDHILTEFIANAVKYRRPEEPLKIAVRMVEEDGKIRLGVSDNGMGIQDVRAVLEKGNREHPEAEGYGGGIASVLRHIGFHPGWTLDVQTIPGEGSTFQLTALLSDAQAQSRRLSDSGFPKL